MENTLEESDKENGDRREENLREGFWGWNNKNKEKVNEHGNRNKDRKDI